MKKIEKYSDLEGIKEETVYGYVKNLLEELFETYEVDSIEEYGAIFFIEKEEELLQHREFYLSLPLREQRFEWIDEVGNGYVNGCIVIDNERAINLIGKAEYFTKYMED
jgi:hypothetical protein